MSPDAWPQGNGFHAQPVFSIVVHHTSDELAAMVLDGIDGRTLIAFDACAKRSARVAGSRPNAQRSIIAGDVWLCGADDGTRTRTLTEKQIFVPPRLSPPSDDVRGLDCPFAIARRL